MNCGEARERFHASLDLELTRLERVQLDAHLAQCGGCRMYAATITPLKNRVSEFAVSVDSVTAIAVLDRVLNPPGSVSGVARRFFPLPFRKFKSLYAAAALSCVVLAALAVISLTAPTHSSASTFVRQHGLRAAGRFALDTDADRPEDLAQWFGEQAGHPVDVPEIRYAGLSLEGGKLYGDSADSRFFCAAYSLAGKPVTFYILRGRDCKLPEGRLLQSKGRSASVIRVGDSTVLSWHSGDQSYVLVTSFDEGVAKAILDSTD